MQIILLIPLIIFSVLFAKRVWEKRLSHPHTGWMIGLTALAFSLLDALLLLALPRLNLSYGAVSLPLFLALAGRLMATLLANPLNRWNPKAGLGMWAVLNLLMSGAIFYGLYVEPFALDVTKLTLPTASRRGGSATTEATTIRIVHLTDLHIERITRRERDVLAQVAALQPDLLLLTGDYINLDYLDDPLARQEARHFLTELAALPSHLGNYAVNGTVDSPEHMAYLFDGLPITVLDDAIAIVNIRRSSLSRPKMLASTGSVSTANSVRRSTDGAIYIVGITDRHNQSAAAAALTDQMARLPSDSTSILLYHTPDLIETAAEAGIDLYLAGHTHGGQIRLPWYGALVTFSAYGKQYEMGQYTLGDTTLYVSRGLGMEGFGLPRARFLCPPEMVVITWGWDE